MDDDRFDELMRRLDEIDHRLCDLERYAHGDRRGRDDRRDHRDDRDHDHRNHHGHDHHERRGGGDFDEKRVVDLIVRLVAERVEEIVERREREPRD
jgi:hypothetical protein